MGNKYQLDKSYTVKMCSKEVTSLLKSGLFCFLKKGSPSGKILFSIKNLKLNYKTSSLKTNKIGLHESQAISLVNRGVVSILQEGYIIFLLLLYV